MVEATLAILANTDDAPTGINDSAARAVVAVEEFTAVNCDTESDAEAAAQVLLSATEYAFAFEAPAAGRTRFTMTNDGQESHLMLLFKVAEGATVDEVLESQGDVGAETEVESNSAAPGEAAFLDVGLDAGDWSMVCYLPDADGAPHFTLGQRVDFTIR